MIEQAKTLIERSFTEEMRAHWTEGTIDAVLKICANVGGLMMSDDALFAGFMYWPSDARAVVEMDWYTLERMNLKTGPILHVAALISPNGNGFALFTEVARRPNIWGVSAHRWNPRLKEWRFTARKNVRFCWPGERRKAANG